MKTISILLCLAAVLFSSCSGVKKKSQDLKGTDSERPLDSPEWVYAPDEGCSESELCAAGEGESMASADSRARKALAAVFSVKINSQFDIHKTSYSDEEVSELKEFASDQVSETVDEVLEAVEIKRRFEKDGLFFSLAALDKDQAKESLRRKIEAVDDELRHLYGLKRKSSIKRMMGLLDERGQLADKLLVVSGRAPKAPATFAQIQNIKFSSGGYNKVYVSADQKVPSTLKKHLEQILVSSGYQVLDNRAVDYVVELKFDSKEAYLNVEGFKKFVFAFSANAKNNVNEKIGSFNVVETQTGRTKNDAFLRAKTDIQTEMESKVDKLNLK